MKSQSAVVLVSMAVLVAAVACGDARIQPPTSPSVAMLSGTNGGNASGSAGTNGATVVGTVTGLSGTCPAVTFALEGKTIKTDVATGYGDGGCSGLTNGLRVGVLGSVQADGSVLAAQVRVAPPAPPPPVSFTGTISGLSGTCPSLSFSLEARTIKTNATTGYGDGACSALSNGQRVGVLGTAQADGSVLAIQVRVTPPPPPPPVSVTGTVGGLSGSCPALSFLLETKTIKTSAATGFGDGACTGIRNGVRVGVLGTVQADGSILAREVRVAPPPPPASVSVMGTISGLSGTCPALSFTLERKTIKTSTATGYGDGACTGLRNDLKVGVLGTAQGDGSILATQVRLVPPPPAP
jgi:hypothetical protein